MNINIIIDYKSPQPFIALVSNNEIQLTFDSIDSYLKYLKYPTLIKFNQPTVSPLEKKQIKIIKQKINTNLPKFIKLLKQETINIYHLSNVNLSQIPNQPLNIDLTDMDYEDIKTFINSRDWSNALFQDRFNRIHNLTIEEMRFTYQKIDEMINKIKSFNPSPAEIAFICFDVARSRIYDKQDISDASIPRDLSCVLAQDKIVCSGFANLFCCLCCALGVYAEIITWESNVKDNYGHDSCLAFINDPKYNLNGIYAFEPTWNSKRNPQDYLYLISSSRSFIPFSKEILEKNKHNLFFCGSPIYGTLKQRLLTLIRLKELKCPEEILNHQEQLTQEALKKVYKTLGRKAPRINSKDKLKSFKRLIEKLESIIENSIDITTFKNLLENAREIEHSIDPSYPNDEKSLKHLLLTSSSYEIEKEKFMLLKRLLEK